jgi:hypothetical protein
MATTIKLKNSVTTTNAPSSLAQGEVAINVTDKKVWVGNAATTPVQLLGTGASGNFSALTCTTLTASGEITQSNTFNSASTFGFKNRIINGDMRIDQRNVGASVTITNTGANTYTLDRWFAYGSAASKFSVQQDAGAVTPPTGFTDYLGVTSLAATSVGSTDQYVIGQFIEGFNSADLAWGTANAATVTMSFWVRSSLTGTFGGVLRNSGFNRSYPFAYTINAANTWEQKSITITGDTTGTWLTTNGVGIGIYFGLGVGSSLSGTAGSWSGSNFTSVTGATSVVGTSGATFYITGVQLEKGSTATSFDYRPYGTELDLCLRYLPVVLYGDGDVAGSGVCAGTATNFNIAMPFKVQARSKATGLTASSAGHFFVQASTGGGTVSNTAFGSGGVNGAYVTFTAPAGTTGQSCWIQTINASAKLYFTGCEL